MSRIDLREASLGFYRVWHAALGARHGLFLALRDAPLDAPTLAAELGLAPDAVAHWCGGAHALGLLARDRRRRYRLRAEHETTLGEPADARYLGHQFEYLAAKSLGFGALDTALGARPADADAAGVYALATRWDHLAFFEILLPRERALARALERGVDVLDLGAGEGGWTREARRRYPASRFVPADVRARRVGGLAIRDAAKLSASTFDVVFLGEVLAAASDPAEVLANALRVLRPGGRLVALEGLLPPPDREPRGWGERLVLAMSLDFALDGSRFLPRDDVPPLLASAGFGSTRIRDLGGSLFAITARKPQT